MPLTCAQAEMEDNKEFAYGCVHRGFYEVLRAHSTGPSAQFATAACFTLRLRQSKGV